MTIESVLKDFLGDFVGGRAYPNKFPQEENPSMPDLWPAIRYVFIDTVFDETICGFSADEDSDQRIQIDAVDRTYDGMKALRKAILDGLPSLSLSAIPQLALENFEPDEKRHRFTLQIIVNP